MRVRLRIMAAHVVALLTLGVLTTVAAPPADAAAPLSCEFWLNDGPVSLRFVHSGNAEHRVFVNGALVTKLRRGNAGDYMGPQLAYAQPGTRYVVASFNDANQQVERVRCVERPSQPGPTSGISCSYRIVGDKLRISFTHTGYAIHKVAAGSNVVHAFYGDEGDAGDRVIYEMDNDPLNIAWNTRIIVFSGQGFHNKVDASGCTETLDWIPKPRPGDVELKCSVVERPDGTATVTVNNTGAAYYIFKTDGSRQTTVKGVDQVGAEISVDVREGYRYTILAKNEDRQQIARAGCIG